MQKNDRIIVPKGWKYKTKAGEKAGVTVAMDAS